MPATPPRGTVDVAGALAAGHPRAPAPAPAPPGARPAAGAGDPYPPLHATPFDGAGAMDARAIAPRSPRAALQPDRVPLPSRRSARTRNPFVIAGSAVLTVVFLLAVSAGTGFVIGKQFFEQPGPLPEDKVVNVPRGGIRDTADLLLREGVIDQPYLFVAGALLMKARNDLKYGEYRFSKHASLRDVVDTMIDGKVVQHGFTVAEGLTSDQIVQRLLENPVLAGNIREIPREGTLLPETYHFTRGTTREQVIQRMQQAQRRAVQEVWERRTPDLPIRSPEQLVTLASIVEKETGKPEERSRVAAVFVNRLSKRMKLQSDPTIIYVRPGRRQGLARPADHEERNRAAHALQHLCDRRPAARPDRQSRPRIARSHRQSGAHQGTVLRRRRHRRPRLRRQLRAAPEERRPPARDRAAVKPAARSAAGSGVAATQRRALTQHVARAGPVRTPAQNALRSRRIFEHGFASDGAVEHDRLCARARRRRDLRLGLGNQVGQFEGTRSQA
jgi:UPF0755 protein